VHERLGHHSPASTQSTGQRVLPGMSEASPRRVEALVLSRTTARCRRDPDARLERHS
jgi:hypothetical protein